MSPKVCADDRWAWADFYKSSNPHWKLVGKLRGFHHFISYGSKQTYVSKGTDMLHQDAEALGVLFSSYPN